MPAAADLRQPGSSPGSSPGSDLPTGDLPTGDLPTRVLAALDRLARGVRRHRQSVASVLGITPLQAELLRTLADAPPPEALVTELANELDVSQPTISESILALERKGHVQRTPRADDRRRSTLSLTASGRHLADQLGSGDAPLRDCVARLPEREQGQALRTLLTVIDGLLEQGILSVARTCLTCRSYQHTEAGARCILLDVELPDSDLQVNCAEHQHREADWLRGK